MKIGKYREKTIRMWIRLFPLIFILDILPLIVHLKLVNTGLESYSWFPAQTTSADFFSWWRSRSFLAACIWMAAVLIYRAIVLKCSWKWEKSWTFLGGYLFFVLLSTVLSEYKNISWNGIAENYEGCLMLLLYAFTFFYAAQVVEREQERTILFAALAVGAIIQAVIGISQLARRDFWGSSVGNALIAPGRNLSFQFADSTENPVYMALYNPNYAAVFIVLVLPVCFYLAVSVKKKWQKAVLAGEILALLVCLWGTGSRAGMITLAVLGCGAILGRPGYKKKKYGLIIVFVIILAGIGIWLVQGDVRKTPYRLQDIQTSDNGIEITTSTGKCVVNAKIYGKDGALLFVKDEKGEKLSVKTEEETGRLVIEDKRFKRFSFDAYTQDETLYIVMYYKSEPFTFVKKEDQKFEYRNVFGKADTIEAAATAISVKYDRVLGSRGYIWNRVLPTLKKYILKGSGPDTFAMTFPQNDYVGRINAAKVIYAGIITKPHSLYVQTAVQTGVLSLLCLLAFYGTSLKKLLKKKGKMWKVIALCAAGYFIMGLVNDSMVVTAPVFWVLLGMGSGVAGEQEPGLKM